MKNFLTKLFGGSLHQNSTGVRIEFIKSRKQVLKALERSKETGSIVGIYSSALGEGLFLTVVEAIEKVGGEEVISFHRYELGGNILSRSELGLSEIKMVVPLNGVATMSLSRRAKVAN